MMQPRVPYERTERTDRTRRSGGRPVRASRRCLRLSHACLRGGLRGGADSAVEASASRRLPPIARSSNRLVSTRAVVVQPTAYGFDNACTLQSLAALGPAGRGVVVIDPATPRRELDRLHRLGVRGVRYMMLGGGVLPWESLEATAAAIEPLGWHIDLQLDGRRLPEYEARLSRLPCRLVIDHTGKFLEPVAPAHEGFQALLRLLESGRCWVKLSAPYETSKVRCAPTTTTSACWRVRWCRPTRSAACGRATGLTSTQCPHRPMRRCSTSCWPGQTTTPRAPGSSSATRRNSTGLTEAKAGGRTAASATPD